MERQEEQNCNTCLERGPQGQLGISKTCNCRTIVLEETSTGSTEDSECQQHKQHGLLDPVWLQFLDRVRRP